MFLRFILIFLIMAQINPMTAASDQGVTRSKTMRNTAQRKYQETDDERSARNFAGFSEFEKGMPFLYSRREVSLIDNISSWLGAKNPLAKRIDPQKDAVWLLDNTAWKPEGQPWQTDFTAAYFAKNSGKDTSKVVADIAEKVGLGTGDKAEETIAKRIQPLLDSILPAHTVEIAIGDDQKNVKKLGPSNRDGLSNNTINIPGEHNDGDIITSHAVGINTSTPVTTQFASSTGWAVISDVDDTIKVTMTSSPVGILKTTFVDDFTPITGMPEFYQHVNQVLQNPPWWYLSASPYNLYPFLREFREKFYPAGPLILREASWMNLAGFLSSLTQGTQAYKVDRMERLHQWFPKRKFLCVGDSTQSDPESYGEIARRYPGWVGKIFIRKVTGVEGMDEESKNSDERFKKAFEGLDQSLWYVFQDPQELYGKLDEVVSQGA